MSPAVRALVLLRTHRTRIQPGRESEKFPKERDFVSATSRIGDLTNSL